MTISPATEGLAACGGKEREGRGGSKVLKPDVEGEGRENIKIRTKTNTFILNTMQPRCSTNQDEPATRCAPPYRMAVHISDRRSGQPRRNALFINIKEIFKF